MFLSHLKPTMVTYFRTSLDPLDPYRVGDIINHGAPPDTSTPAAALATHLREVDPRLRWHTRGAELADLVSVEEDNNDLRRLVKTALTVGDPHHLIMDALTVVDSRGHSFVAAEIRAAIGIAQSARVLRLYCVPNPYSAHYASGCSTGIVDPNPTSQRAPSYPFVVQAGAATAGKLAARRKPFNPSSELQLVFSDRTITVPATEPAAPEVSGFLQVSWAHSCWTQLYRPELGHDIMHDTDHLDIGSAPAIMSSAVQGAGEPMLLHVLDAVERDEHA